MSHIIITNTKTNLSKMISLHNYTVQQMVAMELFYGRHPTYEMKVV